VENVSGEGNLSAEERAAPRRAARDDSAALRATNTFAMTLTAKSIFPNASEGKRRKLERETRRVKEKPSRSEREKGREMEGEREREREAHLRNIAALPPPCLLGIEIICVAVSSPAGSLPGRGFEVAKMSARSLPRFSSFYPLPPLLFFRPEAEALKVLK
jgi:hypothetical protein